MKCKILSFFLCFILIFNFFSYSVFASSGESTENDPSWIQILHSAGAAASAEVLRVAYVDMVSKPLSGFATTVATYDAAAGVVGAGMSYFAYLIQQGNTPDQAVQIMDNSITTSEGNRSVTGDGALYIENYYNNGFLNGTGESLSEIGYVNRWICGSNDLDPGLFMYQPFYECFKGLIQNNPEYYFKFTHLNNNTSPPYAQEYYIIATKKPFLGGVISNRAFWGMDAVTTTLYAEDWTTNFGKSGSDVVGLVIYNYTSSPSYTNYFDWYVQTTAGNELLARNQEDASNIDLDNIISEFDNLTEPSGFAESTTFQSDRAINTFYAKGGVDWQNCIFHNVREAFPVFANLTDLKKGTTGLKTSAALLPSYTGNGINSGPISDSTITQARDIINNYYYNSSNNPGGGGSSNNPGGGGSSDSGSDSLWSVLASAVKNLINFIVDVLGSAIGALTELLDKLVGFFGNARELVGSGFADFVAAFFPYLPEEWITLVSLSIGLVFFFWVLKKFT